MTLHKWQIRDLMLLSNKHTADSPLEYYLCACNGAGKDGVILAFWLIWCLVSKPYFKGAVTSASDLQLTAQTEQALRHTAERYNAFVGRPAIDIVHHHLSCADSRSNIWLFATNEPGRAEGWHPENDWPGAELAIVMSEMKSVESEIVKALRRCRGYNFWVGVSSPGQPVGDFFNHVKIRGHKPVDKHHVSKITAFDCPHISPKEIQAIIDEYGANDPFTLSTIFAEFSDLVVESICPPELLRIEPIPWSKHGRPISAGFDFSLGGDEAVGAIQWGNKLMDLQTYRSRDQAAVARWACDLMDYHGVEPKNTFGDAGGLGIGIIQRMGDFGKRINEVRNEERAIYDPIRYATRGAEMHGLLVRLLQRRRLIIPTDKELIHQLTTRRWQNVNGRLRMEPKPLAKKAGRPHPDRLDAWVLAFGGMQISHFEQSENLNTSKVKPIGRPLPPELLAALGIKQHGNYPTYERLYVGNRNTAYQNRMLRNSIPH